MQTETISVLVVEDEPLIRMSVAMDLEDAGFQVIEASSGDEAIALLRTHPEIRAIFTDIEMPGKTNGLVLAKTVCERWPPIKIIVTSGRVRIARGDLPADALFVAKPYDNDSVVTTLRALIAA